MKFPHLPLGAQFEFDGKAYTKVSPLVAAAEDGSGQRVIPRYAVLRPIGDSVQKAAAHAGQFDPDKLQAAFARFEADAMRCWTRLVATMRAAVMHSRLSWLRRGSGFWMRCNTSVPGSVQY